MTDTTIEDLLRNNPPIDPNSPRIQVTYRMADKLSHIITSKDTPEVRSSIAAFVNNPHGFMTVTNYPHDGGILYIVRQNVCTVQIDRKDSINVEQEKRQAAALREQALRDEYHQPQRGWWATLFSRV